MKVYCLITHRMKRLCGSQMEVCKNRSCYTECELREKVENEMQT